MQSIEGVPSRVVGVYSRVVGPHSKVIGACVLTRLDYGDELMRQLLRQEEPNEIVRISFAITHGNRFLRVATAKTTTSATSS